MPNQKIKQKSILTTAPKIHQPTGALFVVRIRADAPVMQVKKWHKRVPRPPIRVVHNGSPAVPEPLLSPLRPHGELNIKSPKELYVTAHGHPIMAVGRPGQHGARSVPCQ